MSSGGWGGSVVGSLVCPTGSHSATRVCRGAGWMSSGGWGGSVVGSLVCPTGSHSATRVCRGAGWMSSGGWGGSVVGSLVCPTGSHSATRVFEQCSKRTGSRNPCGLSFGGNNQRSKVKVMGKDCLHAELCEVPNNPVSTQPLPFWLPAPRGAKARSERIRPVVRRRSSLVSSTRCCRSSTWSARTSPRSLAGSRCAPTRRLL
jgi:hypothetical protein